MPLKMTMEPQEWLMIGDTKVMNIHPDQAKIWIDGSSPVLRGAHVISADHANTAAKRAYLAVQRLYLGLTTAMSEYESAERELLQESPASEKIVAKASKQIANGFLYGALREIRTLVDNPR